MDYRAMLVELVARAERHVAQGEEHLERQRRVVAERQRQGLDDNEAKDLVIRLEQSQAAHLARRDQLRKELGLSIG